MVSVTQTCYTNWVQQDVFHKLPHLTERHNKYGIRVRVPDELREIIGKREITRSLGTGDPVEGRRVYYEKLAEVHAELDRARYSLNPPEPALLSVDMANNIAANYFREKIYTSELEAQRTANDVRLSKEQLRNNCRELLVDIARDLQDVRSGGEHGGVGLIDQMLRENGFPEIALPMTRKRAGETKQSFRTIAHVDETSEGYKALLRWAYLGQIEVLERQQAILSGNRFDLAKSAFGNLLNPPALVASVPTTHGNLIPPHLQPITLADLLERYMDAHERKSERWKLDMRTSMRPLIELMGGERMANSLSKRDFRDVLAFVQRMPAQIGNNQKKWGGKTLVEIVHAASKASQPGDGLLHPKTVNKYMMRISQVMRWAEAEPLIERNHASGILIPADEVDDDETRREPFSDEALSMVFRSAKMASPAPAEPSIYWATLLALFHGMRSEEILQLRSSDFQENSNGILFIDIHRRDGNRLKNKSTAREVPVHPKMTEFGLPSLLNAADNTSEKSLFRDMMRGAEGKFTPAFSRKYSRFLKEIGAKTERTSFHSYRHSFRDAARNCGVSDAHACSLGGWKYGNGTHTDYGTGFRMKQKYEALSLIEYPDVDFSKVKVIDWSLK